MAEAMVEPTVGDFVRIETALEPHFSSDGSRVAFRWNRPGVSQAFVVDAAGGEARQLTDTGGVTYGLAMRPGHDELMFVADAGGDEQFQLQLVDLESGATRALASAPQVVHNFGSWSADGRFVSYTSNRRARQFFDVYVLNVESGEERLVYQQDGMNGAGVFSADGRTLQIARPNLDLPGDNDLFVVALDESGAAVTGVGGEARRVTEHPSDAAHAAQWSARYLYDDGTVLALSDEGRDFVGLARIDGASGVREYLAVYEWDIEAATVTSEGSRIALVINEDGYSRIEAYEVEGDGRLGGSIELPALPARGIVSTPRWRGDGGALAYTFEGPRHRSEVWTAELGSGEARRLSASAHGRVAVEALPEPELIHYQTFDEREIPAFYYRPTSMTAGRAADGERVPCLVLVHGGPEGQSRPALWGRYAAPHYLLTQGVALLVPNVRGSTGYGKEYCHADDVELRMDSVRDLVAATEWLAGNGEVDPERIGVMGGSYGGFMVLAAITEAPERWRAAIDLFGIADFETFLKFTGPWRRKHRAREYGEDPAFLKTISPIHRADRIETPLLVIQGDHDVRVPQEESEQIVDTVRRNEGIVEYVVYPEEGHGIQKLPNRLDMGERIVAFCREHLLNESESG